MIEGDLVRHKTYEGLLKIKSVNNYFAVCYELDKPKEWNLDWTEFKHPVIICRIENLIKL
jgi:hypothetical protein